MKQKGFIKYFIIITIAMILAYAVFRFDFINFLQGEWFTGILKSIWSFIDKIWHGYITHNIDRILRR
jgi:hypothetical protein